MLRVTLRLLIVVGAVGSAGCGSHSTSEQAPTCDLTSQTASDLPPTIYTATAISAEGDFTCAVADETKIVCWGLFPGSLYGADPKTVKYPAGPVATFGEPIAKIAAGGNFVCAVTESGSLACFGDDSFGQLGVPTPDDCDPTEYPCPIIEPVTPVGLESGVADVGAGSVHACALTEDGRVLCFGMNSHGQTGEPCDEDTSTAGCETTTPYEVTGFLDTPTAVFAGYWSSCALLAGGGAACWGAGYDGLLGNPEAPDVGPNPTPWPVVGLPAAAVDLHIGDDHACAVLEDGRLACWGRCDAGQCGDTDGAVQTSAALAPDLDDVVAVGAGSRFTCVQQISGTVGCFGVGGGNEGVLWDSGSEGVLRPVEGLPAGVVEIGIGRDHGCARMESGSVLCWGSRHYGQLGVEPTGQAFAVADMPQEIVEVAVSYDTVYARSDDGIVTAISLVDGTTAEPLGETRALRVVTSGDFEHTCVLDLDGRLICWGSNLFSEIGAIDATHVPEPTVIEGVPTGLVDVAVNDTSTAVLTGDGRVFLLTGPNREEEVVIDDDYVFNAATEPPLPPAEVTMLGSGNFAVSDGSCVITSSWDAVCLARGSDGEVTFTDYPDIPSGTVSLSRRRDFTCFLSEGGGVTCLGDYDWNQLGHGESCPGGTAECHESSPQQTVGLEEGVQALAGGVSHTCALTGDASVACWGPANGGVLGDGTFLQTTVPIEVVELPVDVVAIDVGFDRSCAAASGCEHVYCWGKGIFSDFLVGARTVHGF